MIADSSSLAISEKTRLLVLAPIAPFISDEMYIKLTGNETVHTAYYPEADENLIDEKVEERMGLVKTLVNLGRGTREKTAVHFLHTSDDYPLKKLRVRGQCHIDCGFTFDGHIFLLISHG